MLVLTEHHLLDVAAAAVVVKLLAEMQHKHKQAIRLAVLLASSVTQHRDQCY